MTNKDKEADLMGESKNQGNLGDQMAAIAKLLDKKTEDEVEDSQGRNSSARAPRATREMASREAGAAAQSWRPADVLPDPPQRKGWVHRWVRGSSRGELDAVNMARSMREGWRPCSAEDYPEIVAQMFGRSESSSTIEFGGLVLCRMPVEMAKARARYHEDLAQRQISSVNERLAEEQRDENRIKFLNDSRSVTNRVAPQ